MSGDCAEVGQNWRTASYSGATGDCAEVSEDWRTASYSGPNSDCVEVATGVLIRDTKNRSGPVLRFSASAWADFLARVRAR